MQDSEKSIDLLSIVARGMNDLRDEIVFIGGITTFIYMDSPVALEIRPTDDVDCTLELTSLLKYEELQKKLLSLNFKHDSSQNAPLCRWTFQQIKVDIIPTDPRILGFTNRWYPNGIKKKKSYELPSSDTIFVFTLPYFIASKLEAYSSRGQNDPRTSSDMEDILLVLDGANNPLSEIQDIDTDAKHFLSSSFTKLRKTSLFDEALENMFAREGEARLQKVKEVVKEYSALA